MMKKFRNFSRWPLLHSRISGGIYSNSEKSDYNSCAIRNHGIFPIHVR